MQDDLIEAMAENIRYDPRTPWIADSDLTFIARAAYAVITDRIAALEAKLAEKDALLRECGGALDGMLEYSMFNEAWQDKHPEYRTKAATTLAKIKDATDEQ